MITAVSKAKIDEKPILRRLLELYAHDFSEYDQADLNEHGEYGYLRLDHYWTEEDRHPFIFRTDDKISGFAMVRQNELSIYSIAEFFILKKYRLKGIGIETVSNLFDSFPGKWQVDILISNKPAINFWAKAISHYCEGKSMPTETIKGERLVYEFQNNLK